MTGDKTERKSDVPPPNPLNVPLSLIPLVIIVAIPDSSKPDMPFRAICSPGRKPAARANACCLIALAVNVLPLLERVSLIFLTSASYCALLTDNVRV